MKKIFFRPDLARNRTHVESSVYRFIFNAKQNKCAIYWNLYTHTLVNVKAPEVTYNAPVSAFFRTGPGENVIQTVIIMFVWAWSNIIFDNNMAHDCSLWYCNQFYILPQQSTFIFHMFSTLPSWAQNSLLASVNQPINLTVTGFQHFCNCQWEDLLLNRRDIQGRLRICFYSVAN